MKINRSFLYAALLMNLVGLPVASAAAVTVSPANQAVTVGQIFSVDITIGAVSDLLGYQFDVGYDPTAVSVLGAAEGSFLPAGGSTFFFGGLDDGLGSLTFVSGTLFGPSGVSGSGTLVTLSLQALAVGTTNLNLNNVLLQDSNLATISASISSGTVIIGASAAPEPSTLPMVSGALWIGALLVTARRKIRGVSYLDAVWRRGP